MKNKHITGWIFAFLSAPFFPPLQPYGQGIQPVNRLRSTTSSVMMCSRCSYAVSFSNSRLTSRAPSQNSIFMMPRKPSLGTEEPELTCKICLMDSPLRDMAKLQDCGCLFCKEVIFQYIS